MKKIVSLFLVILMILSLSVSSFAAEGTMSATCEVSNGYAYIKIYVTATDIVGVNLEYTYDAEALTFESRSTFADGILQGPIESAISTVGANACNWYSRKMDLSNPYQVRSISGHFVTLIFAVNEDKLPSDFAITGTVSYLDESNKEQTLEMTPVTVKVASVCEHSSWSEEVTTEPTCTENGVKTFTCSDCSETWTETITAPGHTEITDAAVAATCTETGLTEGSHCDVCKVVLVAQEVVGATGHSWGEWETVKEPTATEAGEKQRTCASCTEIETEQIEATGDTTIYLLGDVDGNGSVGVNDAVQILKYDAFMDVQSEYEASIWERLGDVNGQGGLNYLDAIDILQWDAFLEFDYPIGEPVEF